jgi:hypothetical protein
MFHVAQELILGSFVPNTFKIMEIRVTTSLALLELLFLGLLLLDV